MQSLHHATPDAVLAYCDAGNTNAQAAIHFSIHERSVRKIKARARPNSAPAILLVDVSQSAVEVCNPPMEVSKLAPVHIPDDWIVRDGQLWKCPICGELMHPLPGTCGAEWNAEGCYLHQAQAAPGVEPAPALEPDPAPDLPNIDLPCVPIGPGRPAPARVVFHPAGQARASNAALARAWLGDHLPPLQVMVALIVAAVLIGACYR